MQTAIDAFENSTSEAAARRLQRLRVVNPTHEPRVFVAFGIGALVVPRPQRVGRQMSGTYWYENRTASVALVSYTTLAATLDLDQNALASRAHCTARTITYCKSIVEQATSASAAKSHPQALYYKTSKAADPQRRRPQRCSTPPTATAGPGPVAILRFDDRNRYGTDGVPARVTVRRSVKYIVTCKTPTKLNQWAKVKLRENNDDVKGAVCGSHRNFRTEDHATELLAFQLHFRVKPCRYPAQPWALSDPGKEGPLSTLHVD